MDIEAQFVTELLPAFRASVRFLSRVNPFVGNQARALPKALSALGTSVRLHLGVHRPVFHEVGFDLKGFATV